MFHIMPSNKPKSGPAMGRQCHLCLDLWSSLVLVGLSGCLWTVGHVNIYVGMCWTCPRTSPYIYIQTHRTTVEFHLCSAFFSYVPVPSRTKIQSKQELLWHRNSVRIVLICQQVDINWIQDPHCCIRSDTLFLCKYERGTSVWVFSLREAGSHP